MKLVTLYAVMRVPDAFDCVDNADLLIDGENCEPLFWSAREGYCGELDVSGADRSSWPHLDDAEPSFWFAEGYSVGYHDTPIPTGFGALTEQEQAEFTRGRVAGRTAADAAPD